MKNWFLSYTGIMEDKEELALTLKFCVVSGVMVAR